MAGFRYSEPKSWMTVPRSDLTWEPFHEVFLLRAMKHAQFAHAETSRFGWRSEYYYGESKLSCYMSTPSSPFAYHVFFYALA